jgi:pimeloyl-ACP methyl ester carboxylesterase
MPKLPVVLIHGYSDSAHSFEQWREALVARGYEATTIHLGEYVTLSNDINIKDIAEGLDRALRIRAGLSKDDPFDALVHSTGMLVVREWLTGFAARKDRLKHLIGLAPATFGSPLAHKGRSWLGALFKGNKQPGPDFLAAGNHVLSALELGSSYTWNLAHKDLLADTAVYGPTSRTPYPFIFIGLKDYGWIKRLFTEPGTDGVIRWSGAGFNSRKITLDLTTGSDSRAKRVKVERWHNVDVPLVFVPDLNHGSILRNPSDSLLAMTEAALAVSSRATYDAWTDKYVKAGLRAFKQSKGHRWQQFLVHALDERGDGINDFYIEIGTVANGKFQGFSEFEVDVHPFKDDPSFRCFHVDLDALGKQTTADLRMRVVAESGSELVGYIGYQGEGIPLGQVGATESIFDAAVELSGPLEQQKVAFFYPFTTTLLEVRMDREPMPAEGVNRVFKFV